MKEEAPIIAQEEESKLLLEEKFVASFQSRLSRLLNPKGDNYLRSPQKRAFDIIGSIVFAPILTPFISAAAAAIKLEDRGPAFFVHQRTGQEGKEFGMIKLRSMVTNAEKIKQEWGKEAFFKSPSDPRVTRVGEMIRKWSIDEFPQFVNVLLGEMSVVGVRPHTQESIDYFGQIDSLKDYYRDWLEAYHLAKPGMASLSTVKGRGLLAQSETGLKRRICFFRV
jgi:lipopolysaccharide/colanic/teichoic acid biosynthesis glycosyltransferase